MYLSGSNPGYFLVIAGMKNMINIIRKKNKFSHISLAELKSVLKGVNLALIWGLWDFNL